MVNDYYRIMALDFGDVRIGIALSDLTKTIANAAENYNRQTIEKDIKHISSLANNNKVKIIVFGLPLNMDGTKGQRVEKTLKFANILADALPNITVEFLDERLTSIQAEKMLISADISRNKRKKVLDKISASIILQNYLDKQKGDNII